MRNHIRFVVSAAALLLAALMLAGCTSINFDPSSLLPTEEPASSQSADSTVSPEATDAPAATDRPADTPYYEAIPLDAMRSIDLDGDGADETVIIESEPIDEYGDNSYSITFYSGADGSKAFDMDIDCYSYEAYAMAVDNGTGDGKKAVLFCFWYDSEDAESRIIRPQDDGSYKSIEAYEYFLGPDCGDDCFENGNIKVFIRSDILGTNDLYTEALITDSGFESVDGVYHYPEFSEDYAISVIAELPVTVVDEATGESRGETLQPGAAVVPAYTDCATYACVILDNGETAMIFFDDFEYIPYINGKPQDHYLDVMYSD